MRHCIMISSLRIQQSVPGTFLCFPFKSFINDWQHMDYSGTGQSCSKCAQLFPLLGEERVLLGKRSNGEERGKLSRRTV